MTWVDTYTIRDDRGKTTTFSQTRYGEKQLLMKLVGLLYDNNGHEWRIEATAPGYISVIFDHQGTWARWEFRRE